MSNKLSENNTSNDFEIPQLPEDYFGLGNQKKISILMLLLVFLFVFVWGAFAQISGAVLAQGRIGLESSNKKIQHREGGIIREIFVSEGDNVKQGQVLLRLDPTVPDASAAIINEQTYQLVARKERLEAERDKRPIREFDIQGAVKSEYQNYLQTERQLMIARAKINAEQKAQAMDQISQNNHEIAGYQAQIDAFQKQYSIINEELISVRKVYELGYSSFSRVSELQRQADALTGQMASSRANISRVKAQISQIRTQILQIDSQFLSEVTNELKEVDGKIAQYEQQQIVANDEQSRTEIKAPVSGKVQQLSVHTVGGVINPGEILMIIVPQNDGMIINAAIPPTKIDDVRIGSKAYIRFTALNTRVTKEIAGKVDKLSSDVMLDDKTNSSFYNARINLIETEIPEELRAKLVAGQPVEIEIETQKQSALSYFLRPILDQFSHIFKD